MKFGLGLILMAIGFLVMVGAAHVAVSGALAVPMWLIVTYFFHTVGELFLSPVGLSAVTKLAPPRYVSQMMGTFFMGLSLGNVFAGLAGGKLDPEPAQRRCRTCSCRSCTWALAPASSSWSSLHPIKKLIGGVE